LLRVFFSLGAARVRGLTSALCSRFGRLATWAMALGSHRFTRPKRSDGNRVLRGRFLGTSRCTAAAKKTNRAVRYYAPLACG